MDIHHPDMQAMAEHYERQRQERERQAAQAASMAAQALAKTTTYQRDLQQAARLAGA